MNAVPVRPVMIQTPRGAVECAVSGEGPAVLALRGAMGGYDKSLLLARAAVGCSGFRFVAVSRPGYLATPLALGETPEEQAYLCAGVLDALGISQAAIIAVSGGGQCALQFALRHGNRCWGLVMVSACSAPLHVRLPFGFRLMKLMARLPWLVAAMRRKAATQPEQAARRSIPDPEMRARTLNDPEAGPMLTELQLSTMDRMAQRLPGTLNDIKQSRLPFDYPLEHIPVPVLVVHGTADQAVPFADAKALAGRLPNAELLTLEGGEHVSLFTHLHEIRTRVTQFLNTYMPAVPK
jgi:pimeloyl-ACP methyl ester carboxylesterase